MDLADSNPNNLPLDVDVFIGTNHYPIDTEYKRNVHKTFNLHPVSTGYWNIIGKHQVRGEYGLKTLESKLSYVLSGSTENSQSNVMSNYIISTHFVRVEAEFFDSDFISNQNIKNCFDSKKPSKSKEVLENFNSSVNFKDGRCEASFPFKEFHQKLGNNHLTSKGRFKNLFKKLKRIKNFGMTVTKLLTNKKKLNFVEKVNDYEVVATHYLRHRTVIREEK